MSIRLRVYTLVIALGILFYTLEQFKVQNGIKKNDVNAPQEELNGKDSLIRMVSLFSNKIQTNESFF